MAELRKIAVGRTDLVAEVAGVFLGTSEGELDEPRARNAAAFCHAAGADPALSPVGRGRPPAGRTSPPATHRTGTGRGCGRDG